MNESGRDGPREFACRACGRWIATAAARWIRGRCMNRSCNLYGKSQTLYADRHGIPA